MHTNPRPSSSITAIPRSSPYMINIFFFSRNSFHLHPGAPLRLHRTPPSRNHLDQCVHRAEARASIYLASFTLYKISHRHNQIRRGAHRYVHDMRHRNTKGVEGRPSCVEGRGTTPPLPASPPLRPSAPQRRPEASGGLHLVQNILTYSYILHSYSYVNYTNILNIF